jgi:hypothetical protein
VGRKEQGCALHRNLRGVTSTCYIKPSLVAVPKLFLRTSATVLRTEAKSSFCE